MQPGFVGGRRSRFRRPNPGLDEKVGSSFRKFPRGIQRVGAVAINPLKWTSKYGSLVITGYDIGTHEGVNEKGLSAHLLYLADEASFGERDPKKEALGIMQWVQYYLDNYAHRAEAVDSLKKNTVQIEPMILPNGKPTLLHLSLSDKTGDSAVIEYAAASRKSIMTDASRYDKQIEN